MHRPVATAQPTPPSPAGRPKWPKISSQLTTTLKASPSSAITITGLVWLMLAL
jgi:hypothetical protein